MKTKETFKNYLFTIYRKDGRIYLQIRDNVHGCIVSETSSAIKSDLTDSDKKMVALIRKGEKKFGRSYTIKCK